MNFNRGFNVEKFTKLFNMRNVMRTYSVFAEEDSKGDGTNPTDSSASSQTAPVNFEQLIAKAREEEKNKLYPTIERLKNENAMYVQSHNDDLIAIATKDKEIERLNSEIQALQSQLDGKESEALKSLKKELKEAQGEVQTLKDSAPNIDELKESIRAEIKSEYDLKFYREKKIQEAGGKIIPELVSGNTEEEINASVEKSMARYNEIIGAVASAPTVNPKLNPANPSSAPLKTSSDAMKALLELDPLSKEYAEARKALGFK